MNDDDSVGLTRFRAHSRRRKKGGERMLACDDEATIGGRHKQAAWALSLARRPATCRLLAS